MTFSIYLNNYSLKCQLKDLSLRFERFERPGIPTQQLNCFKILIFYFQRNFVWAICHFVNFYILFNKVYLRILWNGESQSWMDTDIPFYYFLHVNFAVGRKEACRVVIASPCYIIPNIIIGGTPIIMTSYRQPTVLDWKTTLLE